jgi:hypothetical protein
VEYTIPPFALFVLLFFIIFLPTRILVSALAEGVAYTETLVLRAAVVQLVRYASTHQVRQAASYHIHVSLT